MRPRLRPEYVLRATSFLSSFDRFTIPPLLVPIHRDLGVSLGATAAVASVYFITYGVSQPLWGALSDRIGRVRVMRGAVIGGGAACVVAATSHHLALLIVARGLAGLFFAALVPTVITYVADTLADDERQHALAVIVSFAGLGIAVATVAGGVAAQLVGWRYAFVASVALAATLALLQRGLPEPRNEHRLESFVERLRAVRRQRWVGVVIGLAFVEGATVFGSLTFVAASLQQAGVGAALAGSAAAGFGLANVACSPLVRRAIRHHSTPILIGGGAALAAVALVVGAIESTVVTGVLASLALGAGFAFLHPTMQLWATQVFPQARAVTVSLFAAAIFIGGACASAAMAPLADRGHFAVIFLVCAGGSLVLAVVGPWLRGRYVRSAGETAAAEPEERVTL